MSGKLLRFSALILLAGTLLAACAPQAPATVAPTTAPAAQVEPTKAPAAVEPTTTAAVAPTATTAAANPSTSAGGAKYILVEGKNTASYTTREQLAKRDLPNDVIGKTTSVTGAIVIGADGSVDAKSSQIVVDAATLATDQGMRDNYVRNNTLQTSKYKNITFVPTSVTGLPSPLPQSGPVAFKLTGDLTIKDVTKPVTWDVTGTVNGDSATGTAITTVSFADFKIDKPSVPVVLSIIDTLTLQIDLTLQKSAN
jgi:polyisoprenoid-binding protein YceI